MNNPNEIPYPPHLDPEKEPTTPYEQDLVKSYYQATLDVIKESQKQQRQAGIDKESAEKKASADKDSAEQKAITDEATAEQKAITDEAATELKEQYALQTADWSNEYELHQEVHKGYVEVAKGQIPRSITRAEFIEKVATAISAIYIGIIGVTFALKDNLVPARGIVPSFFLGLSIVLAASYVAFLINSQKDESEGMLSDGTLTGKQYRRYNIFIRWNNSAVLSRRRALQSAVISLGFGLAYLPIPYIDMQPLAVWAFALVGLVLTVLLPFVIDPFWKK